jgi:hypothetical protein
MIKPPCQFFRSEIFEVDDCIFVAGELLKVKERSGAMEQALVLELRIAANALAIEAREERSRAGAVKTLIVIEDLDNQWFPFYECALLHAAKRAAQV